MSRHRALTAALVAFLGTGAVLVYRQRKLGHIGRRGKRRAKRAVNGARKEVVVVSGAIASPIAKSVVLDLERRGFIVYVVSHGAEDEQEVRALGRTDVRPMNMELFEVRPFTIQLGNIG